MSEPDDNLGAQPGRDHAFAVAQAARAIAEQGMDGRETGTERWIDRLERQVRLSLAEEGSSDRAVAQRLVAWAEEAIEEVPDPVAHAARAALVERAFNTPVAEGLRAQRHGFTTALRSVVEADEARRYAEALRDREANARMQAQRRMGSAQERDKEEQAGPNRIGVADGSEGAQAVRQIVEFAELAANPTGSIVQEVVRAGLLGRLRDFMDRGERVAGKSREPGDDPVDGLPESLKKRYGVHVSEDRRTIQLFEPGAKTASITLDARSIATPHNEGAVVADLTALARDRGWQALKVEGTATFRDAIWLEASKLGLTAAHEPSPAVQAAYSKWERDRPDNRVQAAEMPAGQGALARRDEELGARFLARSPDERLADPRMRNAQLELMVGIRTAEKELGRPIAEMPEVGRALTAAVREQLVTGRVFDAPFVRAEPPRVRTKHVENPRIDADRIPPPRP